MSLPRQPAGPEQYQQLDSILAKLRAIVPDDNKLVAFLAGQPTGLNPAVEVYLRSMLGPLGMGTGVNQLINRIAAGPGQGAAATPPAASPTMTPVPTRTGASGSAGLPPPGGGIAEGSGQG